MFIAATHQQLIDMAKVAILASKPMGMGFLHFNPSLKAEDIEIHIGSQGLDIDYFGGRMVKFYAKSVPGGFETGNVHPEYQSWSSIYSSYQDLFEEVVTR